MPHTITVEPLNRDLRERADLARHPGRLAVVLSDERGRLVRVLHATGDYWDAYKQARRFADELPDTNVLTRSSMRPTIVGADLMTWVMDDDGFAPLSDETPHVLGMWSQNCAECAVWAGWADLRPSDDAAARTIEGTVVSRDERGALTMRAESGALHVLNTGQVPRLSILGAAPGDPIRLSWQPSILVDRSVLAS